MKGVEVDMKMKRIICIVLAAIMFISVLFPVIAHAESAKISSVNITIADELITVNGMTSGNTTNMFIILKVLDEKGGTQYFDVITLSGNTFTTSFIPMSAKKGDKLVLKISGDLIYTKEFLYSEDSNIGDEQTNKKLQGLLDALTKEYSVYTDYNGDLEFKYDLSDTEDYLIIKMQGQNFQGRDNIWMAKDDARFKSFLEIISDLAFSKVQKKIRIYVYDNTKTKIYQFIPDENKYIDQTMTPDQLARELNQRYSSFSAGTKTFIFRYTASLESYYVKVVMRGNNFGYLDKAWVDKDEEAFVEFLDKIAEFSQSKVKKDIKIYVYDQQQRFINSYDYFYDGTWDEEDEGREYLYQPIDRNKVTRATELLKLVQYGTNYKIIPDSYMSRNISQGIMFGKLNDVKAITDLLSSLDPYKKRYLVFELSGNVSGRKFTVPYNIVQLMAKENAAMIFAGEDFEATLDFSNIDVDKINRMFGSTNIGFDIEVICKKAVQENQNDFFIIGNYLNEGEKNISIQAISTKAGMSIELGDKLSNGARIPMILKYMPNDLKQVEDTRTINAFKHTGESRMLFSTVDFDKNGILFYYEGGGNYYIKPVEVYFTDINNHWAERAIKLVASKNLISGVGNNKFAPNNIITRAEFVTLIGRLLKLTEAKKSNYPDVKSGTWYYDTVNAVYEAGLLPETFEDIFQPNKPITREEMAYICVKAYEYSDNNPKISPSALFYDDANDISYWAKQAISIATELKIVSGVGNNRFAPKNNATRAEATQIIFNLMKAEGIFIDY